MRRIASFTFIALATFGVASSATAAPAGPTQGPALSPQFANSVQARTQTPRTQMHGGIPGWRPIKDACIICWNQGR